MKCIKEIQEYLGTPIEIVVVGYDEVRARAAIMRAFAEAERIDRRYSRFLTGNVLADLNGRLGEWVELDEEFFELISFGCRVGERTDGAFDLSVKSVLEGWGYAAGYSLQEGEQGCCGVVEIDSENKRVRLSAEIELGGLGKGYALDRMMTEFEGFANVSINGGGDIIARGVNEDGKPWRVIFEHPTDPTMGIGEVNIDGMALACTSPSRRKWRNRHHIVDPKRELPADEMLAVYTQAQAAILADAYSTALFVLGYERAKELLVDLPIEAMLVGKDGKVWRSSGFVGKLFSDKN